MNDRLNILAMTSVGPGAPNETITVTFGCLKVGQKFFDPWTKRRYVKLDSQCARELVPDAQGRAGFKDSEVVKPIGD